MTKKEIALKAIDCERLGFCVVFVCGHKEEEARKNANLIHAMDDMLFALQEAVACGMVPSSSVKDGGASKYSRQVQVADMIRAAIAKATGEKA